MNLIEITMAMLVFLPWAGQHLVATVELQRPLEPGQR